MTCRNVRVRVMAFALPAVDEISERPWTFQAPGKKWEEVEDSKGQPDEPGEADHDQDVALPAGAVDVAGEVVVGGDGVRNGAPVDEDPDAGAGEDQQTEDP